MKLIAPAITGETCDVAMLHAADQRIDGGPSVLLDFVAILIDEAAVDTVCRHAPALGFISDAYAHCRFIGHSRGAARFVQAAGLARGTANGPLP